MSDVQDLQDQHADVSSPASVDADAGAMGAAGAGAPLSLYVKLARVAGAAAEVARDGNNTEYNYRYATLGTVQAMLKPLLAAEGLIILPVFERQERESTGATSRSGAANVLTRVHMTYRIVDSATGEMLPLPWLGEASDFSDKGFAKALTISMRTFLNQLFQIPSYDEDTDPDRGAPQAAQGRRGDGERSGVQKVARAPYSNQGRNSNEAPDESTAEIAGRLRVDQQGEPEQKKVLLNKIRKHMELLELDEPLQVRLIKALTNGRGSKRLGLEELEKLYAKVKDIKFMAEVLAAVEAFESQQKVRAEGGEELFEGAEQSQVAEPPAAKIAPAQAAEESPPSDQPRPPVQQAGDVRVIDLTAEEGD